MVLALGDPAIYVFTGGEPADLPTLTRRYAFQVGGQSADGRFWFYNWVLREMASGAALGYVQATVEPDADADDLSGPATAEIAWVVSPTYQGKGFAREAAHGMATWLTEHGVTALLANIHPDHQASMGVARVLGLSPTPVTVDGEVQWRRDYPPRHDD